MDGLLLEYNVPITQRAEIGGDFVIEGIAINATTTSNGHKFLGEELKKSADSLRGVPILKDHINSVDAIVGHVKTAFFNDNERNIQFKATIKDPSVKQKITNGLINSVSVGAHVRPEDIEESENGDLIPHNITFKELSLVAVPADSGATFNIALNNAYKKIISHSKNNERGYVNSMSEEEKTLKTIKTTESKEKNNITEESKTELSDSNKIKGLEEKIISLKETIDNLKSFITEKLSVKESDVDEEETVTEEPEKEKSDSEESSDSEDSEESDSDEEVEGVEEKGYKILAGHKSFSIERKSYVYE